MPRKGSSLPKTHTEFGGGPGLIDEVRRADRVVGTEAYALGVQGMGEELMEIYATNPADPDSTPQTSDLNYIPRPKPTPTKNAATAKGTA